MNAFPAASASAAADVVRSRAKSAAALLAAAAAVTVAGAPFLAPRAARACPECVSPFRPGLYLGEAKRVGNGIAYSWTLLDNKGKPAAIGVTLSETALEGLAETPPQTPGEMQREMTMLMLPKQAMKTGFTHISLDWNPVGHEPSGIYDKPHFDVHFYTIDLATREKITATGADAETCRKPVGGGFIPAAYVYAKGTEVPMMGGHWINPASPELHGQPFTHTYIYGSYDGRLAFVEPMVTRTFLQSHPDIDQEIALPTAYAKSAYYPSWYGIHQDPVRKEVTIALEGMTWHVAPAAAAAAHVAPAAAPARPVRTAQTRRGAK